MRRLGLIGAGSMAETLLSALAAQQPQPLDSLSVLVRSGSRHRAEALVAGFGQSLAAVSHVHVTLESFIADRCDLVAECAGHSAVDDYIAPLLKAGVDCAIISTGALANDALHARLTSAAVSGRSKLILPSGAIGGLDLLRAARCSGSLEVLYKGRKPPMAWRGTEAERLLDLAAIKEPTAFFNGSARDAARRFPQNANVAAAVALAGLGFDGTTVELVADPTIIQNVHELAVRSASVSFTIAIEGRPSPKNPKTSLTAGFSLAQAVFAQTLSVVAG